MTGPRDNHEPAPEFTAALAADVARFLRYESRLEPLARRSRMRRLGVVVVSITGVVLTLAIGLVWGTSTGYAAARATGAAPDGAIFAVLRAMPVRNAFAALRCDVAAPAPRVAPLQKSIPVVDLPAATARAPGTFGGILGIKQAPDGQVLVNDARRRQLKLFDSTLTTWTVVRDSMPGSATSYGRMGTPLIPYLGDSSLIADVGSQTMLLLDAHGQMVRGVDLPGARIFSNANSGYTGVDTKGRLIIRGPRRPLSLRKGDYRYEDSVPILRADFEQRRVDTIGHISRPLMRLTTETSGDGHVTTVFASDPLQSVDEFAVLSNGALAYVRGHDYHVDWLLPDGATSASAKLPFEWKRRSEDDKTRLADSVRAGQNALLATGYGNAEVAFTNGPCDNQGPAPGSAGRGGNAAAPRRDTTTTGTRDCTRFEYNIIGAALGVQRSPRPPLADLYRPGPIDDYDAPIRAGSTVADLDGNLWVLPRTTTLSQKGELVYDVINAKGELFQRVRLPIGRAIGGFAKGGVLYLTSGDLINGFTLERTRLPK